MTLVITTFLLPQVVQHLYNVGFMHSPVCYKLGLWAVCVVGDGWVVCNMNVQEATCNWEAGSLVFIFSFIQVMRVSLPYLNVCSCRFCGESCENCSLTRFRFI